MDYVILRIASRYIIPIQLALAVFFLLRGHNEPGGGFIGGLVAASAVVLRAFVDGPEVVYKALRVPFEIWMGLGLLLAIASGLAGNPFLTAVWDGAIALPIVGKVKLGTPLLFDIGVFIVVFAVTVQVFLTLFETRDAPSDP